MSHPGSSKEHGRRRGLRKRFRHRVEYAVLRTLSALLTALPLTTASALMGRLWQAVGPFTARHERIGRNLARLMPETSPAERREIAAAQWNNLGRTFAESIRLTPISADPSRVEVVVDRALDEKLRQPGRGAVFVICHLANWETATFPCRVYGPALGLYRPLSNPHSERFIRSLREKAVSARLLPKGPETAGRVMEWVRAGNTVGIVADLYEARGIAATFFGKPTLATPFPAMVARRLGVPLVSVRTMRLPGARFRLEVAEIPLPKTGAAAADVRAATQAMLDRFEGWIRERPGEWMWVQKRDGRQAKGGESGSGGTDLPAAR